MPEQPQSSLFCNKILIPQQFYQSKLFLCIKEWHGVPFLIPFNIVEHQVIEKLQIPCSKDFHCQKASTSDYYKNAKYTFPQRKLHYTNSYTV